MVTVSFLTPTIPERAAMLEDTIQSVKHQDRPKGWQVEHLWLVDDEYAGCSRTMNELARRAAGSWLVPLADDDIVLPWFLREHAAASKNADVVYSPPHVTGAEAGGETQFWGQPPNIPAVAMIRKRMWDEAGGYDEKFRETEDRALFEKLMGMSARFERVDRQSWVYRFHGANKSRGHIPGLATQVRE